MTPGARKSDIVVEEPGRENLGPELLEACLAESLLDEAVVPRPDQPPVVVEVDVHETFVSRAPPDELGHELRPLRGAGGRSLRGKADEALLDDERTHAKRRGGRHYDDEGRDCDGEPEPTATTGPSAGFHVRSEQRALPLEGFARE
jgi:hypothetical protein